MKRRTVLKKIFIVFLGIALIGCSRQSENTDKKDEKYHIYELAVQAGYEGTYEEWLETIKGPKGDQGEKGEQGEPGKDGVDGKNGKDGFAVLTGNGIPNNNHGTNGDSYIDLDVWDFYIKTQDEWVLKGSIKGDDPHEIIQMTYDKSGNLIVTFSDGSVLNAGKISNACEYEKLNNSVLSFDIGLYKGETVAFLKKIQTAYHNVSFDNSITIPSVFEGYIVKGVLNEGGKVLDSHYETYTELSLTLPETIDFIGCSAFKDASFKTIVIPNSCRVINEDAFKNCVNMSNLIINSESNLETICNDAFANCVALKSLYIPKNLRLFGVDPRNTFFESFECHKNSEYYTKNNGLYRKIKFNGEVISHSLMYYPSSATEEILILDDDCFCYEFYNNQYLRTIVLKNDNVIEGLINSCFNVVNVVLPKDPRYLGSLLNYDSSIPNAQQKYQQQMNNLNVFYPGTESEFISIPGSYHELSYKTYYYSAEKPLVDGCYWRYVDNLPEVW